LPRRGEEKPICPVCGHRIDWVEKHKVGERIYYYAVHVVVENGEKKRVKHYLGPEEYEYVSHTHRGVVFQGAITELEKPNARLVAYLNEIISILPNVKLEPSEALSLAREFKQIGEQLEQLAREREREGEAAQSGDDSGSAGSAEGRQ